MSQSQEENNAATEEGASWPVDFLVDVKAGLDKAMHLYDEIIQELARSAAMVDMVKPIPSPSQK